MNLIKKNCKLINRAFIILSFLFVIDLSAQNLVLNPSFENVDSCFTNCENTASFGLEYLPYWDNVSTADLMASCNEIEGDFDYNCIYNSVPLNWQGYQFPHTGQNYLGYYFGVKPYNSSSFSNNLRDYPVGRFSKPLEKDKMYCLTFFVSQGASLGLKYFNGLDSNYSNYLDVDKIGVKFYNSKPSFGIGAIVTNTDLDMRPDSLPFFSDTLNWMKTSSVFIARGNEQYMLIGNLYAGNNISSQLNSNLDEFWITQTTGAGCYHYIDDLELIEIPDIVLSSSDSEIVVGESVILSASEIAEEQVWFASDATQAIGTGLSVEVNPTLSSTYYLRSLKCKMYLWDTVYVKVHQPLPPPFEPLKLFISNTISKENFLINYTGDERPLLTMALFNSIGQLVHVQEIAESTSIATSDYAPGIYYCRIFKNSASILTEKIVVMK
jgi:hypothetical protein